MIIPSRESAPSGHPLLASPAGSAVVLPFIAQQGLVDQRPLRPAPGGQYNLNFFDGRSEYERVTVLAAAAGRTAAAPPPPPPPPLGPIGPSSPYLSPSTGTTNASERRQRLLFLQHLSDDTVSDELFAQEFTYDRLLALDASIPSNPQRALCVPPCVGLTSTTRLDGALFQEDHRILAWAAVRGPAQAMLPVVTTTTSWNRVLQRSARFVWRPSQRRRGAPYYPQQQQAIAPPEEREQVRLKQGRQRMPRCLEWEVLRHCPLQQAVRSRPPHHLQRSSPRTRGWFNCNGTGFTNVCRAVARITQRALCVDRTFSWRKNVSFSRRYVIHISHLITFVHTLSLKKKRNKGNTHKEQQQTKPQRKAVTTFTTSQQTIYTNAVIDILFPLSSHNVWTQRFRFRHITIFPLGRKVELFQKLANKHDKSLFDDATLLRIQIRQ